MKPKNRKEQIERNQWLIERHLRSITTHRKCIDRLKSKIKVLEEKGYGD